ncbi:MAG TPA: hypothetical protein VI793_14745 [Anaerolineales bacterium]|nr:hypothetical protein [Anaerolineales bacterium]
MKRVIDWAKAHPRLAAWIVLGLGMDAMVAYEARDVGLLAGQWIALIVATTLVAGLCVWIIGWEDDDEEAPSADQPAEKPAEAKK